MKRLWLIILFLAILSCSTNPQPINYGSDMCNYCQMTIVTKTHAAQMVTDKGKQYKFDAIECMIRFLDDKQNLISKSNLLITDYNAPGTMTNAKTANYVVCEEISSPMGANLTGFATKSNVKELINSSSAEFYDWDGIFKKLN